MNKCIIILDALKVDKDENACLKLNRRYQELAQTFATHYVVLKHSKIVRL